MKKIIAFGIFFFFFFIAASFAENSIKAEIDKTSINTDETLTYKISIISSQKQLPPPQIPKFAGFNILSQAQSSTVSFRKNNLNNFLVYVFILSPRDIGKFKIEPASIVIQGKTYTTDGFEIEVRQGKAKAKPPTQTEPYLPKRPPPETEEPQITL